MSSGLLVAYGMTIRLRHVSTGAFLASVDRPYVHPGTSRQFMVGGCARQDRNTLWLVKPAHHQRLTDRTGQVIGYGDAIRLEHVATRRNLHSHDKLAPLTAAQQQYEVTAYAGSAAGEGNEQDNWLVYPEDGKQWTTNTPFRLRHIDATGRTLHSHGQADQTLTAGLFEVTAVQHGDANDLFECQIEQSPADSHGLTVAAAAQRETLTILTKIARNFDACARQLLKRHANRKGFRINDEYDLQDLLQAILRLHFDDVREEEYGPSVAGKHGRMDFLLPQYRIAVETKMARKGLGRAELITELAQDSIRFRKHPELEHLFCFVYDPQRRCHNPSAIESDLSTAKNHPNVHVVVSPR